MIPKMRFEIATMALPVPRSLVGKSSGETAYRTPYMTLLVKVYPQFHPSSASLVRDVVLAKRNTPVRTGAYHQRSEGGRGREGRGGGEGDVLVETASVPLRPR